MRDYGKLHCAFWTSPSIRELSDDARLMAAYLLTSPHGTLVGCFRLPDGYISEDMNWGSERVSKGFAELVDKGFVTRCERTKWVRIVKFLEWNPLENPNQVKAAQKVLLEIPDELAGKLELARLLNNQAEVERLEKLKPLRNPLATVSKPVTVTVAVDVTGTVAAEGAVIDSQGKPATGKTSAVWDSYSKSYAHRYGATPLRNKKVNGMLAKFLERVPVEAAPDIAAFYLTSNRGLYVSAKHPIDLLLRDAEGLHTEWVTGRQTTETEARQADKTAATGNVFQRLLDKQEREHAQ